MNTDEISNFKFEISDLKFEIPDFISVSIRVHPWLHGMNDKQDQPRHQPLPVLPNSGKVEQLRRDFQDQPATSAPAAKPMEQPSNPPADPKQAIEQKVITVIKTIYDPEIPVSIYELGLIYDIDVKDDNSVHVKMTLTAPGCPVAGSLPIEVENRIQMIPEVPSATVELVWDPPWNKEMMSEEAKLTLGFM
jgi:FeS assembly SUF system protein